MREQQLFEAVYREHAVPVYRYLLRIGCPPQDAEDVLQETFVKALLHIDSFRGECAISVWLCQIAKNTWYKELKKQKRERPDSSVEHRQEATAVTEWLELIERLEEPQQTVFLKRALGGWSYAELAEAYGRSESWARVTFHRAKLRIQAMLRKEGTE